MFVSDHFLRALKHKNLFFFAKVRKNRRNKLNNISHNRFIGKKNQKPRKHTLEIFQISFKLQTG